MCGGIPSTGVPSHTVMKAIRAGPVGAGEPRRRPPCWGPEGIGCHGGKDGVAGGGAGLVQFPEVAEQNRGNNAGGSLRSRLPPEAKFDVRGDRSREGLTVESRSPMPRTWWDFGPKLRV